MSKKILIIDDSAVFRKVLNIHLKTAGFEISEASDGIEALKKVAAEDFNLIVCDVNMPNMDGLTFVSKIRDDEKINIFPL